MKEYWKVNKGIGKKRSSAAMEENNQRESQALKELCRFHDDSKEWITYYFDYIIKFNMGTVERKLSFSDLNGILV